MDAIELNVKCETLVLKCSIANNDDILDDPTIIILVCAMWISGKNGKFRKPFPYTYFI